MQELNQPKAENWKWSKLHPGQLANEAIYLSFGNFSRPNVKHFGLTGPMLKYSLDVLEAR